MHVEEVGYLRLPGHPGCSPGVVKTKRYDHESVYPTDIINAEGHRVQARFDARFGQLQAVMDPNSIPAQDFYDEFGRNTLSVDPGGSTVIEYASAQTPNPFGPVTSC